MSNGFRALRQRSPDRPLPLSNIPTGLALLIPLTIRALDSTDDVHWCATLMASSQPWLTLGRSYAHCRALLETPDREVHLAIGHGDSDWVSLC